MNLIVCEKNIAARKVSAILAEGKVEKGSIGKVDIFSFTRAGDEYVVVGLRGHIINLDYPPEYNRWYDHPPRALIDIKPVKVVKEKGIASALRKLAKEARKVIIATDYDREGELIGVEALNIILEENPKIEARRMRFSAFTKVELETAFADLVDIDMNLSSSAESRQVVDLAWGAALTRFISLTSQRVGREFLSVGRVQTPTLALIVEREKSIMAFVPEPYWEIEGQMDKKGVPFKAAHKKGRFKKIEDARKVFDAVKGARDAKVTGVERKEKKEKPPAPFNTTAFLREATKIGFSAAAAMTLAEGLYTEGYISYPRTDNTVYPKSLDLREVLTRLASSGLSNAVTPLLDKKDLKPTRGKKEATDHPPIYPVEAATEGSVKADAWKIYELVVRRFLATLSDETKTEHLNVGLDVRGEPFNAKGQRTLEKGWRGVYPYGEAKEVILPPLSQGDTVVVDRIELLDKETKPPKRMSQGGLIEQMDNLGLGTKSTRHEIIQKLYNRGYVEEKPPRPTVSGIAVTDALADHAPMITKADMTATLEKDMGAIADGTKTLEEVVAESNEMLSQAFDALEENKDIIGKAISTAMNKQNEVGTCTQCGKPLLIRTSRFGKRFVGCSGFPKCRNSFPLPQRGRVSSTGEACEACRSPIVKIINGKRPWNLCINMDCQTNVESRNERAKKRSRSA